MRLKDRVAIVTGSSRNLGQGVALGLAREGARLVVNGSKQNYVENSCRMIAEMGVPVIGVTADVSTSEGAELLVNRALEEFGRIDILVNNAAVVAVIKHFLELTPEVWDAFLQLTWAGCFSARRAWRG